MDARRGAVAVLLMMALPFLSRALTIDEPLYLTLAERVLAAPLDPFGGASFWHDRPTQLYWDSYNPPLIGYLLAAPVWLAPGSSAALRLPIAVMGGLCIWLVGAIARDLGLSERTALLVAASPVVALASASAMTDIPFLLLSLLAWRSVLAGRAGVAGLLAGLSALLKYVGLINLAVVALCVKPRRRPLAIALAASPLLLWGLASFAQHGRLHPMDAARFQYFSLDRQGAVLASFVAALGLVAVPGALVLLRRTRAQTLVASGIGAAAGLAIASTLGSWRLAALGAVALGGGAALSWAAVVATRNRAAPRLVSLLFWSYAIYSVVCVYFAAARYLLPLLPPLVWLLAAGGQLHLDARPRRWLAALGAGVTIGVAVLWADAGYANAWARLTRGLPPTRAGRSIGHWGFQHYATLQGYPPLLPRETLEGGASVAVARGVHGAPFWPGQRARLDRVESLSVTSPAIRVMDRLALAGYYSDAWGPLPLGWRPGAVERLEQYRVVSWLAEAVKRPLVSDEALVRPGSGHGRHALLDGWSSPESYTVDGIERPFAWTTGAEAALRLILPAGVDRLSLLASADPAAGGRLEIGIGPGATAHVELAPGWREYEAPIEGVVEGGETVVVLRPTGYRRLSRVSRERRELAVAIEAIGFGASSFSDDTGAWPVLEAGRPALLVARSGVMIGTGGRPLRGVVTDHAGDARLSSGETVLWRSTDCRSRGSCNFELEAHAAPVVLWASDARLRELAPAAGTPPARP